MTLGEWKEIGTIKAGYMMMIGSLFVIGVMLVSLWIVVASPPNPPGDLGEYYDHSRGKAADYNWNERQGTITEDGTGQNNHAICSGTPSWVLGRFQDQDENAVRISNSASEAFWYVPDDNVFDFTTDFTISCIVKVDQNAGSVSSFCDKRGYGGQFGSINSGFFFGLENGYLTYRQWNGQNTRSISDGDTDYRDGNWHFFSFRSTRDGNTMSFWLYADPDVNDYNDIEYLGFGSLSYPLPNSCPLVIGAINGNPTPYGHLSGIIDDLHLFDFPAGISYCSLGKENYAYFGLDEAGIYEPDGEDSAYCNDRLTWDYHCLGIRYGGLQSIYDKVYGAASFDFDGNDDYVIVNCGNSLEFNEDDDIYVELWFKCEDLNQSGYQFIVDKFYHNSEEGSNGYSIFIDEDNYVNFEIANGWDGENGDHGRVIGSYDLEENLWYHLYAWYDSSLEERHMKLLIEYNNAEVDSGYCDFNGQVGTRLNQELYFGRRLYENGPDDYFDGKLDEVILSGFNV